MNEYLILKLKEGRINKGLKQSDVTKFTGIKNTTISNYENGVTEPDIDTFLQLCELYELDYAGILAEAYGLSVQGEDFKIRPSEIEHIEKYRDLDPHGKKMVDFTLNEEWERSTAIAKENALKEKENLVSVSKYMKEGENKNNTVEFSEELTPDKDYLLPNAAHADESLTEITEEMIQEEEDIMDSL